MGLFLIQVIWAIQALNYICNIWVSCVIAFKLQIQYAKCWLADCSISITKPPPPKSPKQIKDKIKQYKTHRAVVGTIYETELIQYMQALHFVFEMYGGNPCYVK